MFGRSREQPYLFFFFFFFLIFQKANRLNREVIIGSAKRGEEGKGWPDLYLVSAGGALSTSRAHYIFAILSKKRSARASK